MKTEQACDPIDLMGPEDRADFYRRALTILEDAGIEFMIGGAYALQRYTGICRDTKDIDVFIRSADVGRTLGAWANAGLSIELTDPNWLAKAFEDDYFVDVIFNSGNGLCPVDDGWFQHATEDAVLGKPVKLCPLEEMLWQKTFIMERERHDGADFAHIVRAHGPRLDWDRLLARVGDNWEVLFAQLTLVNYIYPNDGELVPQRIMDEMKARIEHLPRREKREPRICRGTLISRYQYLGDIYEWGYLDPRPRDVKRDPADAVPETH